jgi:Domain of unknown function (DUF6456)
MTAKSVVEYVVPILEGTLPKIGQYYASPSGQTVLLLTRVAKVIGAKARGESVRIYCLRLRRATLPPDITVLPWPRERPGRPRSRAAEPSDPTDKPAIQTQQQRQKIERERIRKRRIDAASDPANQLVAPIRRQNGTARASTWRDPADTNILRRTPKTISAFRADDPVDRLLASGTITRGQAWAARRLRIDYERGELQQHGSVDLSSGGGRGFEPGTGPSEFILMALERFQSAKRALGRLFSIVFAVCIEGTTLRDVAARLGISPPMCAGRLSASLEALVTHYELVTPKPAEDRQRPVHTIGAQLGVPAE